MEKLIIIRGPSASGKTKISKELYDRSNRPTLLVSEDRVRKMFNDWRQPGHTVAKELATREVLFGLGNRYDVIYEGILNIKTRSTQFDIFLDDHPKENYFFYFDVSWEETVRRHQTRPENAEFDAETMKTWWEYASPTGHISEIVIPETSTQEETIKTIGRVAGLELLEPQSK